MASIYRNGRVTIAAANSRGSDDGRFIDTSRYISKVISVTDAGNNAYFARARRIIDHGDWPLLKRGSVFQERLLSPRVIHFGCAEVVWECFMQMVCQCSRSAESEYQKLDFMLGRKNRLLQWTLGPEHARPTEGMPTYFWANSGGTW
jgi:hypothetical protein